MEIVTIDLAFEAQADPIRSRPERIAQVPVNPRAGDIKAERRSKNTEKRPIESVIDKLPPSTGRLKPAKFGTMASSATAGSSNESVPGKKRLPAIPWACAE